MSKLLGKLRSYLIAGILVTAPISITLYLAWNFIAWIDTKVIRLLPPLYHPENYLPISVPGLGVIIMAVFLIIVGALTANFFGRLFVRIGEAIVDRMPVVRSIYGAIKQIMETVLASKSTAFREVILVEYPRKDCWVVGFITGQTKGEVHRKTNQEMYNVFVPTTPNPTSGFLLFVPHGDVIKLDMSVEEGIKMVVSGGIVVPLDPESEEGKKLLAKRKKKVEDAE